MTAPTSILVINPGSTSTKLALYRDGREDIVENISHPAEELARCASINDQLPLRREAVRRWIAARNIHLVSLSAIASRGGGGRVLRSGGYAITGRMVEEYGRAAFPHASNLGAMIAWDLMREGDIPGYIYDAPLADDFCEYAKITGLPEVKNQRGGGHTLNEKAVGRQVAARLGRSYEDCTFVICHLGGGITVGAHKQGKILDTCINAFSPERAGCLPTVAFTRFCYSGQYDLAGMLRKIQGRAGLVAYLGSNSVKEIEERKNTGDAEAAFYLEAMVYHIAKDVGAMAATLDGAVDRVILTGEIARSNWLTASLAKKVAFIAPVEIIPGTFEMEALAAGVGRIVRGEEAARDYDTENAE